MKELIGASAKHNTFGIGTIKEIDGDKIIVAFEKKEMKLKYPDAFEKFITLDDESLQCELLSMVEAQKIEKEELVKRERELAEEKRKEQKRQMLEDRKKRGTPSRKTLKKGDKFKTHVEVINACFGFNHEDYQQAYKVIDEKYAVWFPSIAKRINGKYSATDTSAGWINIISDNDTIITECNEDVRQNVIRDSRFELDRFVFAKFVEGEYQFMGVYKAAYDTENIAEGYRYELVGTTVDLLTMEIK